MSAEADELRRVIRDLHERRARGDVRDKDFERRLVEHSVALSRVVASARLAPGESILAEHHLAHSHLKLTQSVLKEPEQSTASFFASERRLIRVRNTLLPGRPVSYDEADGTVVDEMPYAQVERVVLRRQPRWGEAGTGVVVTLLALLLGKTLAVTGPILVILGVAGVVHGTLFPTRSFEIVPRDSFSAAPFEIHGIRRRGARKIVAIVRGTMGSTQVP